MAGRCVATSGPARGPVSASPWRAAARVAFWPARRSSADGRRARPPRWAGVWTTPRGGPRLRAAGCDRHGGPVRGRLRGPARGTSSAGRWARPSWLAAARTPPCQRVTRRLRAAGAARGWPRRGCPPGQRASLSAEGRQGRPARARPSTSAGVVRWGARCSRRRRLLPAVVAPTKPPAGRSWAPAAASKPSVFRRRRAPAAAGCRMTRHAHGLQPRRRPYVTSHVLRPGCCVPEARLAWSALSRACDHPPGSGEGEGLEGTVPPVVQSRRRRCAPEVRPAWPGSGACKLPGHSGGPERGAEAGMSLRSPGF